jgi:hypothetical protein
MEKKNLTWARFGGMKFRMTDKLNLGLLLRALLACRAAVEV